MGSPDSVIDHTTFSKIEELDDFTFGGFEIRDKTRKESSVNIDFTHSS